MEKIINNFYLVEFIQSFFIINVNYLKLIDFFERKFLFIISATYYVINKLLTIAITFKFWRNLKFSAVSKKLCDEGRIRNHAGARIPLNHRKPRGFKFFQPYSLSSPFDDYFNF